MDHVLLEPHAMAHGGEAVARLDGKAHFVAGALPGETVAGAVVVDKGNWARVELASVAEPSPDRVEPRCRHFDACGGCNWQIASPEAQLRYKSEIVAGQLSHLGGVDAVSVRPAVRPSGPFGYRNRMDFRVLAGTVALGRRASRDLVALTECHLLHAELVPLFESLGDLSGVERITLRISEATGQRLVVIDGEVPAQADEWPASVVVRDGDRQQVVAGDGHITETIDDVDFRISGAAFFQVNSPGAAALTALVEEALEPEPEDVLVDAYAGGGLFAATVGSHVESVLAIEIDRNAARDLRFNLERADGPPFEIIRANAADVLAEYDAAADLVIVDPPRSGLGKNVVESLSDWSPRAIAYVSCDPASLARDARRLAAAGYTLKWAAPVDMFPQTHHIETVARFTR